MGVKSQVDVTNFEEYAEKLIEQYQIPGTALGIAYEGTPIYEKGFGYRNIKGELPVTMDTVFGIASVTKSFTCVAIMQLQEAGKLSVHDPVVKYLPEFTLKAGNAAKITIHHFMTHTAGLPPLPSLFYANKRSLEKDGSAKDYPGLNISAKEKEPIDTYEQLMAFIGELDFELLGEPGTVFSYSNDSYALLGTIIERVSGKKYEKYIKENILEPIGMEHSCCLIEELEDYDNITTLYAQKETKVYEAPVWWDSPAMRAAGYLKSTVHDMLKYAEIYRNNGKAGDKQILSAESIKQMTHPHIELTPGRFYGYGLVITPDYFGATLVEHGGNLKAIASQLCIIPERGITAMILTNLAGVPAITMMKAALNAIEGRDVEASPIPLDEYPVSAEELADFAGTYTSNEGMKLTVTVLGSGLEFSSNGIVFPAQCISKDSFIANVKDQSEVIRFIRDEIGKIVRVAYHFRQFPKDEAVKN
ncbi:serine hydrolase [Bacillaceae bacterium Marseille-Q3522]|nr:serine hydrolase [Bacillaceae bacterium Marseille-Q3522]